MSEGRVTVSVVQITQETQTEGLMWVRVPIFACQG